MLHGRLLAARGQFEKAIEQIELGRETLAELGFDEQVWDAELAMAEIRLQQGQTTEARKAIRRASAIIEELAERVPAALQETYRQARRRSLVEQMREQLGRSGATSAVKRQMALPKAGEYAGWRKRYGKIIGEDRRLLQIFRMIDKVADSDSTIFVHGESGTGKELIAQAIHDNSSRRDAPFIKVNCAAFVETLLLSELFGHEKGAFTGALSRKKGRFELAHGGTIFLDEIGDISPNTQVALLRVLQEKQFERVGGGESIDVNVRVIVATNRNIEEMVKRGEFRLDLYYRLKGIILELPALRERRGDIPILLQHFVDKHTGVNNHSFSADALGFLARYSWPGNIRELENFTRSMTLLVDERVVCLDHVLQFQEFFTDGELVDELPDAVLEQLEKAHTAAEEPEPILMGVDDDAPQTVASETVEEATQAVVEDLHTDPSEAMLAWARRQGMGLPDLRKWLELECIKKALLETGGNITKAAAVLDMKRPRLSQIINANPELSQLKDSLISA